MAGLSNLPDLSEAIYYMSLDSKVAERKVFEKIVLTTTTQPQ
jgi:hypothetical protein